MKQLAVYVGERKRAGGVLVTDALLDLYERHGIATSVVLRGVEGFGRRHQLRTDSSLTLSEDLPAVVVALDTGERVDAVVVAARALAGDGLVTVEPVAGDGAPAPATARLTVYIGRKDRVDEAPASVAVTELLYRRGIAGATALLGVDGTVAGRRERARFFATNAQVPMVISAVGPGDELARLLPELAAQLPRSVRTVQPVRICKRDGVLLARPQPAPSGWQKLIVYSSETAQLAGAPLHRTLVRRLRAAGARGATTLRGVWGFHGAHAPHGDRVFQLGRHVPTVTTVIDTAERVVELFPIVDELTRERGLVTAETIPAPEPDAGR